MKKYICIVMMSLMLLTGCSTVFESNATEEPMSSKNAYSDHTYVPRATVLPTPEPTISTVAESMQDMSALIINNENIYIEQKTGQKGKINTNRVKSIKQYAVGDEYFLLMAMQDYSREQFYTLKPNATLDINTIVPMKMRLYIFQKKDGTQWQLTQRISTIYNSGSQCMLYQMAYADLPDRTIIFGGVGDVYLYSKDGTNKQESLEEEWNLRVTKMVMKINDNAPITMDTSENWGYITIAKKGARVKELSVYAGTRELPRAAVKNYVVPYPYQCEDAEIVNY